MSLEMPLKRKSNMDSVNESKEHQLPIKNESQTVVKKKLKRSNLNRYELNNNNNNNHEQQIQSVSSSAVTEIDDQVKSEMIANYQPWVIKTYGDLAKTKTITLKKYARIIRTLRGDEVISADNSKFRFWVKAKGFHLGKPDNYDAKPADSIIGRFSVCDIDEAIEPDIKSAFGSAKDPALYVPNTQIKNSISCENDIVYRKVAIVENFFDIIYSVHVELEGRPGKHAGQKRTYRTITETYAFLPREAVTRFLLGCTLCQRRPRSPSPVLPTPSPSPTLTLIKSIFSPNNYNNNNTTTNKIATSNSESQKPKLWSPAESINSSSDSSKYSIDYNLPITSTYLKYMRSLGCTDEDALKLEKLENVSTPEPNENIDEDQQSQQLQQQQHQQSQQHFNTSITGPTTAGTVAALNTMGTNNPNLNAIKESDKLKLMLLAWNYHNQQAQGLRNGAELGDLSSLIQQQQHLQQSLNSEDMASLWANYHAALKGKITPPNVPRDQSPAPGTDAGSIQDETSSSGNKEDDDDDDDESDDRIDTQQYDPDRLKAFNMFVRLFVDENLDRMVPISKQPKEKIQAIIDSCTRQFPEFTERARKRIRTYLKSCRRNKRARDSGSNWDAARPTPAHLTSVQAEQLLASACENESHNAKRMRLGLEPISQPMPILSGNTTTTDTTANMTLKGSMELPSGLTSKQDTNPTTNSESLPSQFTSSANSMPSSISTSKSLQAVQDIKTTSGLCSNSTGMTGSGVATSVNALNGFGMNTATSSGGLYRPNFSQAFPRNNTAQYSMFPMQQFPGAGLLNGPTDLSMKHNKPILTHKLNSGEIAAVRQLITGYRESAAFLIRSADELEQLLQQQ